MIHSVKEGSYTKIIVEDDIKDKSQLILNHINIDSAGEEQKTS